MKKELKPKQQEELFKTLKTRFEKNMGRHKGIDWTKVHARLESDPAKLCPSWNGKHWGRTDVVGHVKSQENSFLWLLSNSPKGRRSICMMTKHSIKERTKPEDSAWYGEGYGISILTKMNTGRSGTRRVWLKTSSWIATPLLSGNLRCSLCDRRYNHVFDIIWSKSYYGAGVSWCTKSEFTRGTIILKAIYEFILIRSLCSASYLSRAVRKITLPEPLQQAEWRSCLRSTQENDKSDVEGSFRLALPGRHFHDAHFGYTLAGSRFRYRQ